MNNSNNAPKQSVERARYVRKQPRAIATHERVVLGSAKVFDEIGFAATSITDMIDSAGLSKGAVFYHFASKEAIAQHIVGRWSEAVTGEFGVAALSEEPVPTKLRVVFASLAERMSGDVPCRAGLKLSLDSGVEGAADAYRHFMEMASALVGCGIDDGTFLDEPRTRRLAFNLCSGFTAAVLLGGMEAGGPDLVTRVEDVVTAHLAAVSAP